MSDVKGEPLGSNAAAAHMPRTRLMLEAPIGPTLAKLAAPNMLSMFVLTAQIIAEAYLPACLASRHLQGWPWFFH